MHEVKTSKQKGSLILKIAVAAFACYIIYLLISQQVSINNKKTELSEIDSQIAAQEVKNEELKYALEAEGSGTDEYAEEYARGELDYAKSDERVFVNIGGN